VEPLVNLRPRVTMEATIIPATVIILLMSIVLHGDTVIILHPTVIANKFLNFIDNGRLIKNVQMQGARGLRKEAYL